MSSLTTCNWSSLSIYSFHTKGLIVSREVVRSPDAHSGCRTSHFTPASHSLLSLSPSVQIITPPQNQIRKLSLQPILSSVFLHSTLSTQQGNNTTQLFQCYFYYPSHSIYRPLLTFSPMSSIFSKGRHHLWLFLIQILRCQCISTLCPCCFQCGDQ